EAFLPFQAPRPRGQLRNREATGFVDVERQVFQLDGVVADLLELAFGDAAAADRTRRDTGLFGENTRRKLFGRHFAGVKAHNAAVGGLSRSVRLQLVAVRAGDVVGDVGGQRGLAHAGPAGEDDQV